MKTLNIVHLGPGKVGKTFLRQLTNNRTKIEKQYRIKINLVGIFNSKGKINITNLNKVEKKLTTGQRDAFILKIPLPLVIIDTSASDETTLILEKVLKKGCFVIMSNKKPIASNLESFKSLYQYRNRLFFETTVGAGLPIINILLELMQTGDEIIEINGCFSGTLGYIFSLLEQGKNFSQAILEAKEKGFTEPDPRDDLSGLDVARKALILARVMGRTLSLKDIELISLYPKKLDILSVGDFLNQVKSLDIQYNKMMNEARKKGKTLRYIAKITKKTCSVDLTDVDLVSDIGSLNGPDNISVIKTRRYFNNPLVIKGPGAGLEVTAGGVFGDLLKIIKIIGL